MLIRLEIFYNVLFKFFKEIPKALEHFLLILGAVYQKNDDSKIKITCVIQCRIDGKFDVNCSFKRKAIPTQNYHVPKSRLLYELFKK